MRTRRLLIEKKALIATVVEVSVGIIFILCLLNMTSCDNSDDEPATIAGTLVGKTWKVQSVKVDGVNRDDVYQSLILKFTDSQYESTNGSPIWKGTGTWSGNEQSKTLVFDGDLEADVVLADKNRVTIKFEWDDQTYAGGRSASVSGKHELELVVQ